MKFNFKKVLKIKNESIIFYDSNTKMSYSNVSGTVTQYTKKLDNKLRVVSTFPFDTLLKANVEVPKTIDELDVDDFVLEQAYKQLNIPSDAAYELSYFKLDVGFDADHWSYDVYAVDGQHLEKSYDDLVAKTQYIDVITCVPFLPLILYKTNKLDLISNHIFVFIGDNNGTFAFYSKGEPIYIKTLVSSVYKLRIEFNQETSLEVNSLEFEDFVSGRAEGLSEYRSSIDSMLNKISRDIEENILYIKKVYQDLEPTALYFGMSVEYDSDFITFFRDSLLIETKPYNSLAFNEVSKGNLAIADIAMYYADKYIQTANSTLPNFSYAKRPTPLSQRDCGQFVMIAGGVLAISLLYPVYNFAMKGYLDFRSSGLEKEYNEVVFPQAEEYRAREDNLKKQIENLNTQNASINNQITAIKEDMAKIYAWQSGYAQKSAVLGDIIKLSDGLRLRIIKSTLITGDDYKTNIVGPIAVELNVLAANQDVITEFIRKLNESNKYKRVETKSITRHYGKDNKDSGISSDVAKESEKIATSVASAVDNNATSIVPLSSKVDLSDPKLEGIADNQLNSEIEVIVR